MRKYLRKYLLITALYACNSLLYAQETLQSVTDRGAGTTKAIGSPLFKAIGGSLAGPMLPTNIYSLSGLRIEGNMGSSSHNAITYQSGGGGGAAIGFSRGGSYDTAIDFYTAGSSGSGNILPRLRIADNGKIGVGTINPIADIDVGFPQVNALKSVLARLPEGNSNGSGTYLGVSTGNTVPVNVISFSLEHKFNGSLNNAINFYRGASYTGGYLGFATNNGTEKMRIDADGNVGIGTTTPGEKLTVNGKVHAKEIKVDLNVPGPDYVFEENYPLQSLSDIQSFISKNKHLPEIPSAKEMKENGINVGEMNMLLLKKVEELTLHLIRQDKEITALKNTLKTLISKEK